VHRVLAAKGNQSSRRLRVTKRVVQLRKVDRHYSQLTITWLTVREIREITRLFKCRRMIRHPITNFLSKVAPGVVRYAMINVSRLKQKHSEIDTNLNGRTWWSRDVWPNGNESGSDDSHRSPSPPGLDDGRPR
jgi:hypothetical protein